jgi:hypothetical protein
MNPISEKFFLFITSSFAPKQKAELFEYICKNYQRRIDFYVSQIIPRSHAYHQDVCQEVMLKIYNHLDTFNPLRSFKAWVFKIVRHQCLDLVKSKEEKWRKLQAGDPDLVSGGAGILNSVCCAKSSRNGSAMSSIRCRPWSVKSVICVSMKTSSTARSGTSSDWILPRSKPRSIP